MVPLNALIFIFVLRVTKGSLYTRDVRFSSMSNSDSTIRYFFVASRLLCAGLCNGDKKCSSFVHNRHDGRCQLLSKMFYSSQRKTVHHGNTIYRRVGVCKVPLMISNGKLLSLDGQVEGSKAWFICDDFHFTNISHGICRPDGVWEGLDKPCVHLVKPPYTVQSKNRIIPGKCFILLATTYFKRKWPKIYFNDDEDTMEILHISFRFRGNMIVRNSFVGGHWGKEIMGTPYWPLKRGREANITVCIEKCCFRVFVDGREMFTYAHRAPVNTIDLLVCKVPPISNRKLLPLDGQDEGSQAWFICDDFHFTNISHAICRPNGGWEGLDKPCVLGFVDGVEMFTFIHQVPVNGIDDRDNAFYLSTLQKPMTEVWYSRQAVGHNTLQEIIPELTNEAGLKDHYTNHSLRATAATALFRAGVDEQFIMEQTGHKSVSVCKVPSISNGKLLSFDGQDEGSKARFICDDYHFNNISHGTCRPDGVWEGLDKPCVHLDKSPYIVESKNRIIPGKCVIILATLHHGKKWPMVQFTGESIKNEILHISFRFDEGKIVRNNKLNGKWGIAETNTPPLPSEDGREANITVCTEESCFRGFVDGVEMFTFKHRIPVNQTELLRIVHFHVRRLTFTDWRL